MIKRSESQWRELFANFDKSDLSAAVFCRENKLCPKYFSLRRKQLGAGLEKANKQSEPKPRFSKIEVSEPVMSGHECRFILPNGVTVVVSGLLTGQDLSDLLHQAMRLK